MVTGEKVGELSSPLAPSVPWIRSWLATLWAPLATAGVALALAASTLMPDVSFWDTAEFQTVAPVLGTAHSPGYPTYVILGWLANLLLAPFGEPAFRMNLFSALCVAGAAGLTAVLVRQLTGRGAVGAAAGIGLAATPLAWRVATHAEPHSLHLAMVGLLLVLLVGWEAARRRGSERADRWLVAAAATFGLAAGNHSLTLLLGPAIGLYVLAVEPGILRRPRFIALCAGALFGLLALVYLELPLRAGPFRAPLVYGRPDTWEGFWYIALAQQFQGAVGDVLDDLPRKASELAALASRELGPLALLLPAAAIVTVRRFPRFALLTGVSTLTTVAFSASYANADIGRYYLGPLLMTWTWLAVLAATAVDALLALAGLPSLGAAADEWPERLRGRAGTGSRLEADGPAAASNAASTAAATATSAASTARGPTLLSWAVALAVAAVLILPTILAVPVRQAALDERLDRGARVWLEAALGSIAQNAVVVSWWSYSTPLWYAQHVEGRRPDVFVVDDRTRLDLELGEATDVIARYLGQRPVYVIRANQHDLDLVLARFQLRQGTGPASNVYEVVGPVGGPA